MKKICILLFLFIIVSNLGAQPKQNLIFSESVPNHDHSDSNLQDDIVNTPFGPALKSNIHYIDKNHHLNIKCGKVQIVKTKSGSVVDVYGNLNRTESTLEHNKYKDGWNTYAVYLTSQVNKPPTYFSAKWIVPPAPKESDQLLYFFNAVMSIDFLENGNHTDHIIQPVLQWGLSPAGGGKYWAICNWYVTNELEYFHDSLIVVKSGTLLEGVLKQTSTSNNRFSYNSSFSGYPTGLQVDNLPQILLTYIALESYGAERSDEYPTNQKIKFFDIHLETDTKNTKIPWDLYKDEKSPSVLGQFTKVINTSSDRGVVEIYFRKPYSIDGFDEIQFYPNPFIDYLHISPYRIKNRVSVFADIPITDCEIEIFDSFGKLLKNYFYANLDHEFDIDLSNLNSGLYLIKFKYDNRSHTFKIIKAG
ncbi:MAG: T9SS type A sorting domain-containing protein [Bacteroidota bacterium]|nr:hypothetical protein [Odoribacter sp.]MDP3643378.1 T9SS type A sorting domain-containing protein [Bacteroidota bacterium]